MTRVLAAAAAATALFAPAAAGTAAAPPIAISASPTILALDAGGSGRVHVVNPTAQPVTVAVTRGDYAIAPDGHVTVEPKVAPNRSAKAWISVSPAQLHLAPNGSGDVVVASHPPKRAEPGDHHALVLLTARASGAGQVAVRARVGVGVLVRMAGTIRRQVKVAALRVVRTGAGRSVRLTLRNAGNVNEVIGAGRTTIALYRGRRLLTTLRAPWYDLLPHQSVTKRFAYRGKLRGRLVARVRVRPEARNRRRAADAARPQARRAFRVRF